LEISIALKEVPAEVFVSHKGVTVYHCYDNGMINEKFNYIYTLDPLGYDNSDDVIDIRDFGCKSSERKGHMTTIIKLIDSGRIDKYGVTD
jgi:hypothetical protein